MYNIVHTIQSVFISLLTASYDQDHAKSNLSKDNLGCDTLDELADKHHFFQVTFQLSTNVLCRLIVMVS